MVRSELLQKTKEIVETREDAQLQAVVELKKSVFGEGEVKKKRWLFMVRLRFLWKIDYGIHRLARREFTVIRWRDWGTMQSWK